MQKEDFKYKWEMLIDCLKASGIPKEVWRTPQLLFLTIDLQYGLIKNHHPECLNDLRVAKQLAGEIYADSIRVTI